MNLSQNIAIANRFQGHKAPMTLNEANAQVPQRATALFGVGLIRRLAAAQKAEKADERPAQRNPNLINS
jgi:hypothetical protein